MLENASDGGPQLIGSWLLPVMPASPETLVTIGEVRRDRRGLLRELIATCAAAGTARRAGSSSPRRRWLDDSVTSSNRNSVVELAVLR